MFQKYIYIYNIIHIYLYFEKILYLLCVHTLCIHTMGNIHISIYDAFDATLSAPANGTKDLADGALDL